MRAAAVLEACVERAGPPLGTRVGWFSAHADALSRVTREVVLAIAAASAAPASTSARAEHAAWLRRACALHVRVLDLLVAQATLAAPRGGCVCASVGAGDDGMHCVFGAAVASFVSLLSAASQLGSAARDLTRVPLPPSVRGALLHAWLRPVHEHCARHALALLALACGASAAAAVRLYGASDAALEDELSATSLPDEASAVHCVLASPPTAGGRGTGATDAARIDARAVLEEAHEHALRDERGTATCSTCVGVSDEAGAEPRSPRCAVVARLVAVADAVREGGPAVLQWVRSDSPAVRWFLLRCAEVLLCARSDGSLVRCSCCRRCCTDSVRALLADACASVQRSIGAVWMLQRWVPYALLRGGGAGGSARVRAAALCEWAIGAFVARSASAVASATSSSCAVDLDGLADAACSVLADSPLLADVAVAWLRAAVELLGRDCLCHCAASVCALDARVLDLVDRSLCAGQQPTWSSREYVIRRWHVRASLACEPVLRWRALAVLLVAASDDALPGDDGRHMSQGASADALFGARSQAGARVAALVVPSALFSSSNIAHRAAEGRPAPLGRAAGAHAAVLNGIAAESHDGVPPGDFKFARLHRRVGAAFTDALAASWRAVYGLHCVSATSLAESAPRSPSVSRDVAEWRGAVRSSASSEPSDTIDDDVARENLRNAPTEPAVPARDLHLSPQYAVPRSQVAAAYRACVHACRHEWAREQLAAELALLEDSEFDGGGARAAPVSRVRERLISVHLRLVVAAPWLVALIADAPTPQRRALFAVALRRIRRHAFATRAASSIAAHAVLGACQALGTRSWPCAALSATPPLPCGCARVCFCVRVCARCPLCPCSVIVVRATRQML